MKRKVIFYLVLCIVLVILQLSCRENVNDQGQPDEQKLSSKQVSEDSNVSEKSVTAAVANADKGEGQALKSQQDDEGKPAIRFDKNLHDFGNINPGSRNKCEFKFTNTGTDVLKVDKKIGSTCGCAVPLLEKEKYQPGESGIIKVTYTAGYHPGSTTRSLSVKSNAGENPLIRLKLKANITKQIDYTPSKLELLIGRENGGCPDITLKTMDGKEFAITKVFSSPSIISIAFDPNTKAKEFVLTPVVDKSKLRDDVRGHLDLRLSHPGMRKISIPFTVKPKLKLDPPVIIVPRATQAKVVSRDVWLTSNYNEDFEITDITSKEGITKVLKREKFDHRYKLQIKVEIPNITKDPYFFRDTLEIKTNQGDRAILNIMGTVSKPKDTASAGSK